MTLESMHKSRRIWDILISTEIKENLWHLDWCREVAHTYTSEEYLVFSLGRVIRCYNSRQIKITSECVLIFKREYIILFAEDLKLYINLWNIFSYGENQCHYFKQWQCEVESLQEKRLIATKFFVAINSVVIDFSRCNKLCGNRFSQQNMSL